MTEDSGFWDAPHGWRAIPWDELIIELPPPTEAPWPPCRRRVQPGGRGLRRNVPLHLRHVGCMWLEGGDESRRCHRRAAWVMGDPFGRARVYCEEHGWQIRRVAEHRNAYTTSMSS